MKNARPPACVSGVGAFWTLSKRPYDAAQMAVAFHIPSSSIYRGFVLKIELRQYPASRNRTLRLLEPLGHWAAASSPARNTRLKSRHWPVSNWYSPKSGGNAWPGTLISQRVRSHTQGILDVYQEANCRDARYRCRNHSHHRRTQQPASALVRDRTLVAINDDYCRPDHVALGHGRRSEDEAFASEVGDPLWQVKDATELR